MNEKEKIAMNVMHKSEWETQKIIKHKTAFYVTEQKIDNK